MKDFLKNHGLWILFAGAVIAVALALLSYFSTNASPLVDLANTITSPFRAVCTSVSGWFTDKQNYYEDVTALKAENEALKKQVDELEHVIFTNFSHKPAVKLAQELEKVLPEGLSRFTFHDNGSSCVEAALKMAFQYHYQTGHPERTRFMCLPESYHGETIGALSVGSMDFYAKIFHPMLMDNIHFDGLDCYRCPYGKTRNHCGVECFESAENAFKQ